MGEGAGVDEEFAMVLPDEDGEGLAIGEDGGLGRWAVGWHRGLLLDIGIWGGICDRNVCLP